ncbi:hypothetical protein GSI_10147 [Ganoderma sinense ZZ0214-1]|uniref:F-box domain-containing protein n=1 Tax=Ganoderma sinense ZZ0214-1 TaxID=1077348 RepID=A0A2G8S0D0_9APHY|nr:hypothetical protein GSI_10147 [Ganoderma sinense ZZ0214-1]
MLAACPHWTRALLVVLLDPEQMADLSPKIKQRLLCVSHCTSVPLDTWRTFPLAFSFTVFPNLRSPKLRHSHFHPPASQYLSLRRLQLDHCVVRPLSSTSRSLALCAIQDTLQSFPNLEMLSLTCCLSAKYPDDVSGVLPAPRLMKTVRLPRLRHLELSDAWDHISRFLSHLVFPPTAALALGPFRTQEPTLQLFAGVDLSLKPHATTLHLELGSWGPMQSACWELRGAGVRPLRVAATPPYTSPRTISRFTRDLAADLAPGRGPTTFTLLGMGSDELRGYWDALPASVCPVLEVLALNWSLPRDPDGANGEHWRVLRDRDAFDSDGGHLELEDAPVFWLLRSLRRLCDALRACLSARAGRSSPQVQVRRAEITLCPCLVDRDADGKEVVLQGWQVALAGERIREKLGNLVGDIAVVGGRSWMLTAKLSAALLRRSENPGITRPCATNFESSSDRP